MGTAQLRALRAGDMRFLAGEGEMARLIRSKDWSRHPFGPTETWPHALRAALGICLQSAFPMAIYWGPELRLLYNDSWSQIPGPRHPVALGAPAREVWPDIWHVLEPQFAQLAAGEAVYLENQMLPMRRYGAVEETYWTYSLTPIYGDDGTVAGVFNAGNETTRTILAARQMRFMLELGEILRGSAEPEAGRMKAAEMLGRHLGVDRVGFAEVGADGDRLTISAEWVADGVRPVATGIALSGFGPFVEGELRAGRLLRIEDVAADPRLEGDVARETFLGLGVRAVIGLPWMDRGRLAGAAYLHAHAPRAWSEFDVGTIEELLERTRGWIERQRAEERERILVREVDHRARNALAVAQSVVRLTRADDPDELRAKIEARIGALARAHGLLADERWRSIDFGALVRQELAPFIGDAGERLRVEGPSVPLPADLAQTLALVLHELATNAAKHGALAAPAGRLAAVWRATEAPALEFEWRETVPGAAFDETPGPAGFGTTLLKRVVEGQLRGALDRRLGPDGLVCRIVFPLAPGAVEPAPAASDAPQGRVLILEDEALVALDLEMMVAGLGYDVFGVFATEAEAEAALAAGLPDVALLDANLRGLSSAPFAQRLRARGVPIVFATGYGAIPGLPAALADAPLLGKPVSEGALAAALEKALADRAELD